MTKIQVINSTALKRHFVKEYSLPIVIFDNPYFEYRLHTFDKVTGCLNEFNEFCKCLSDFENEHEYLDYYCKIKDEVIGCIRNNPSYIEFDTKEKICVKSDFPKRNLYAEENDGSVFVSIDMKKANFSALRYYDKNIFNGASTWEEYINNFTTYRNIIESKYTRQVILGNCNSKRQIDYEYYLMDKLVNHVVSVLPEIDIYSLGEDEILIKVPNKGFKYSKKEIQEAVDSCPEGIGNLVRIEIFELHRIKGNYGWAKHMYDEDSTVRFKCIDPELYPQIIKHYFDMPIDTIDLVFMNKGHLAVFVDEIDNPWET